MLLVMDRLTRSARAHDLLLGLRTAIDPSGKAKVDAVGLCTNGAEGAAALMANYSHSMVPGGFDVMS
jgi:hypothetical protein